jgi:glyoxylase I family protein
MLRRGPHRAPAIPTTGSVGTVISPRISHVDITVGDLSRSLPFYRDLRGPIGWPNEREVTGERGETIHYLSGDAVGSLGIREAQTPAEGRYDRYSPGLHHICFGVDSREVVDERAAWLRETGVEIESGPQEYDYQPGYYAVFFYDPDGIKLELVHFERRANPAT